jgi:long-chain acyl-CoA synthetase
MEEFERRIGRPLMEGLRPLGNLAGHALDAAAARRKLGSIGLPFPRHRHEDSSTSRPARASCRSASRRAVHRGPQVMKGYWNKPGESAQVPAQDADGRIWFHTGDVASSTRTATPRSSSARRT